MRSRMKGKMKKVKSIKDLEHLMESLGAEKEAGDGWASWTLECGPKPQATSSKRQATSSPQLESRIKKC